MATDDDRPEPTVKQLLAGQPLEGSVDAATQAQLARWFTLPSFEELAERPPPPGDPGIIAAQERRDKAIAAVDPVWLERYRVRTEERPEALMKLRFEIELYLDPDIALIDLAMIERGHMIAEPREVEIPEELREDLKDCTPQALLRDLHRAEINFDKTFEVVDTAAEQRLDIVAEVATAMATNWKLPPLESAHDEARQVWAELVAERRRPWTDVLLLTLPNRTVTE